MSFRDIFKKSFLEGYAGSSIDLVTIVTALGIACVLALYIFLIYRVMTRKTFYSKNFNISLAGVSVITTALILTMQSSVVLSLGMVGALSIVRFRTAVKDPMDLMFLFWAISNGIICGAGIAQVAIMLSVMVTVGLFILNKFPLAKAPMILVINAQTIEVEDTILETVKQHCKHYQVKSRNVTAQSLDMIIELRIADGKDLVSQMMNVAGVASVSLLSHDGETTY